MPIQAVLVALRSPLARLLPHWYHRCSCRALGIKVEIKGVISPARPTLFVSNHVSYLDIEAFSAAVPVCFVAKSEVGTWPFFGWLARLQRTVFVSRRARGVSGERDEVSQRLEEGDNIVLFPEATSGDGARLLPFKSSFLSVAERPVRGAPVVVQPVTIAYTQLDGQPLGHEWRPFFAWYGDMELASHLWQAMGLGRVTVQIQFHEPVTIDRFGSRKALSAYCEQVIAAGLEAANTGRAVPAPAAPGPSS